MTIYERVLKLVEEQKLTIKQLERECELANATIRRWETQTPNIESVRRVAHRLNVTIDYLVNGDSPNTTEGPLTCDGTPLVESEADLIAMFRLLDEKGRETAFDFVTMLYEKATGEKASIYSTYTDTSKPQKSDPASGGNTKSGTA